MKNALLVFGLLLGLASISVAQIKVEASGDVGIGGLSNPSKTLDVNGDTRVRGRFLDLGFGQSNGLVSMNIGGGRVADGDASVELIADDSAFPSYGFRFRRTAAGLTNIEHRGTNSVNFRNFEAADTRFWTDNTLRMTIFDNGNVGIGVPSASHKLTVSDDIKVNGVIIASDKRLKSNVASFHYGLNEILKLKPLTYHYSGKGGTNSSRRHTGVFAQDLQSVMPELVSEYTYVDKDEDGNVIGEETFLQIDDTAIKYAIINAVREQQDLIQEKDAQIAALQEQFDELTEMLTNLQSIGTIGAVNTQVQLTYYDLADLNQNTPNPFSGSTQIAYIVPSNANSAQINIFDMRGKLIKEVDVQHTGEGRLTINATEIPAGTYSYQLQIDGKVVDNKKMVIAH